MMGTTLNLLATAQKIAISYLSDGKETHIHKQAEKYNKPFDGTK